MGTRRKTVGKLQEKPQAMRNQSHSQRAGESIQHLEHETHYKKEESHHKTVISFTQLLQMSEFSGFHFSPLNATASGVRSDESDTASFPQHLTSPPKPKCPHYNSGCLLERPPQGARESLKAQNSTTRVVLAARHQVADCWCVQGKAQGTIFPGEGENKCNETVISLGSLQRNLHFSTSGRTAMSESNN